MDKQEALRELKAIEANQGDIERDHARADDILLELIDDEEISEAYYDIDKWYA